MLLFTSDGFPAILAQSGSLITANVAIPLRDFTLLMHADFTALSSGSVHFVKVFETSNNGIYDSLVLSTQGISGSASSPSR